VKRLLALVCICLAGCGHAPPPAKSATPVVKKRAPRKVSPSPLARVSKRPGNKTGHVLIVEYHHIRSGKNLMFRPVAEFKRDLNWFYEHDFRPVTMTEYITNKMPLAPGASPVVFTFDDSDSDQYRILPDGTVDPNCAVGIWQDFAESHPDFPIRATFYVLPYSWGQPRLLAQKLKFLESQGSEIGNHTYTHPPLRRLSDAQVEKELGMAQEAIIKLGVPAPTALAYPYGSVPKHRKILTGFEYDGQKIRFLSAVLAGAQPAPSPSNPHLRPYAVPRIIANHKRMGLDFWMKEFEEGRVAVYVEP